MQERTFVEIDILIIGAGMAGCTSALSLHRDFNILLVDKGKSKLSNFTETLIASSKRIFKQLDMQHWLQTDDCLKTYRLSDASLSLWGNDSPTYTDSLRNPEGENLILNKTGFVDQLRAFTNQFPFPFLEGMIDSLHFENGFWYVEIKTDQEGFHWYKVKQLIDASGRSGVLSRKLGIKKKIEDQLICISALINNHSQDLLPKTFSDQNGWWFVCPLNPDRIQVSYYTDADLVSKSMTGKEEHFKLFLTEKMAEKEILQTGDLGYFEFLGTQAANTSRLEQFCGIGWAAIGDAAMCFDPLSSQGSFKAMATAMQLSDLLKTGGFVSIENEFSKQMEAIWLHYRKHQEYYYHFEHKRKENPFWNRRIRIH